MKILRQLFLDNLTLKIISLMLAFLLWLQIAGQQEVQTTIPVAVEFVNMPSGLEITNDYPKEVNFLISKPSAMNVDNSRLAVIVNLSTAVAGTNVYPITDSNIRNLPSGVSIEGIEQRRIRLQLERTRRKIVKIEPEIVGQPAEGYQIADIRLSPSEVLISGPESRLEQVSTAETESIDIDGMSETYRRNVYLDLEDPRLRIEQVSSVDVIVIIEEERRKIPVNLSVRLEPSSSQVRIRPRTVQATLSVPISFTDELETKGFRAVVTLPDGTQNTGSFELEPTILIPEVYSDLVRVESVDPERVRVTF